MTDLETRLRTELRDVVAHVVVDEQPPAALVRAVRRRRRRRTAGGVLVVLVACVGAGVGAPRLLRGHHSSAATQPNRSSTHTSSAVLPEAPISADRRDATGVWTGTEFIVWGGQVDTHAAGASHSAPAGVDDGGVFGDGAAYNPSNGQWRVLSRSPLNARTEHIAIWTGSDMLVWGGSGANGSGPMRVDGALYNPATDEWRSIKPAPSGFEYGKAVLVGSQVLIAGEASSIVLDYDLRTDSWRSIQVDQPVEDITATSQRAVVLTRVEFGTDSKLSWIDPSTGTVDRTATETVPSGRLLPDRMAISARGDVVYLAWEEPAVSLVTQVGHVEDAGSYIVDASQKGSAFEPPRALGVRSERGVLMWSGDLLISYTGNTFGAFDSRARTFVPLKITQPSHCGVSAANAWADGTIYSWAGQTCGGNGSPFVNGIALTIG